MSHHHVYLPTCTACRYAGSPAQGALMECVRAHHLHVHWALASKSQELWQQQVPWRALPIAVGRVPVLADNSQQGSSLHAD